MKIEQRLDRSAYTDELWLEREKSTLFANSWFFVGTGADVPKQGDFACKEVGDLSVILLRDKNEKLVCFHNFCRHRATQLLEGSGNIKGSIICPYHRWAYALDGRLKGVPNQRECFPGLDKTKLGLKQLSVRSFNGFIFAHASDEPDQSFEQWSEGLSGFELPHDIESSNLTEAEPLIYEMKCNWKVFVENAIDGYHLGFLHEETLGKSLTPDSNLWERVGDHLAWYSTEVDGDKHALPKLIRDQCKDAGMKAIREYQDGNYPGVLFLFPNTLITPTPFGISVSQLIPVDSNKTKLFVRTWRNAEFSWADLWEGSKKDIPGFDPEDGVIRSKNWKKHALDYQDFQTEDIWICEKIQRSMKSPITVVGPLAQGWGAESPVAHFQTTLLSRLGECDAEN